MVIFRALASSLRLATSLLNTSGGGPSIDSKATVEPSAAGLIKLPVWLCNGEEEEQPPTPAASSAAANTPIRLCKRIRTPPQARAPTDHRINAPPRAAAFS